MNRIEFGDCRDIMRRWIADGVKVQTCITSPPYWGLRDYGVDGQLGLEPTLDEYIANMVEVFQLVRELLTDDGTLWLNMGDSYAGSRCGGGHGGSIDGSAKHQDAAMRAKRAMTESRRRDDHVIPRSDVRVDGLKPKDLIGQPWMLAFALRADGWYLRQDIIWHKPNPMPESVRDRCTKAHEYVFLLSKSERYYFDQEAIKEPCSENTHARYANNGLPDPSGWADYEGAHGSFHRGGRRRAHLPGNKSHKGTAAYEAGDVRQRTKAGLVEYARKLEAANSGTKNNTSFDEAMAVMPTHRNKRSVWTIASEPYSGAHFATFPTALVRPCILAGSRPGDAVLDPFMGSGTTAGVALELGRTYLGCELNEAYAPLQDGRVRQQGLALV